MRLSPWFSCVVAVSLTSCTSHGSNPADPFEPFNRKVYAFNEAVDATTLKPVAKFYKAVVPKLIRKGINNAFNNLDLIPTVANDLLQAQGKWAIKDSWRFAINSTLGLAGFLDVANQWGLPPHSNDLGLTLARWGDTKSPYLVLPLLGPSTVRDGYGLLFQFALYSPYVYLHNDALIYSLLALRYVDLRSQLLDSEALMQEAIDRYAFMRDAYLQHRHFLMGDPEQDQGALYVSDD